MSSKSYIQIPRTSRFAIVGAGPAGVHFAHLLAKQGFNNITVLEADDHVGGKSFTVTEGNIPYDMGTVLLTTSTYGPVFDLLENEDPENKPVPFPDSPKKNYCVIMGSSQTGVSDKDNKTFTDRRVWSLKQTMLDSVPAFLRPITPLMFPGIKILLAARRYRALHEKIFGGKFKYGMPPSPPSDWSLLNMTALQFLEKHRLKALIAMFRISVQLNGYGVLESIPAFYAIWWMHPDLVDQSCRAHLQKKPILFGTSKGFQHLWETIAAKLSVEKGVKFLVNAPVSKVTRHPDSTATVEYTQNGILGNLDVDYVVMAVDLSKYVNIIPKLTSVESKLFTTQYTSSVYASTLYKSDPGPFEFPMEMFPDRMTPIAKFDESAGNFGHCHTYRNARLMLRPRPDKGNVTWGPDALGRQQRVAYQFLDRPLQDAVIEAKNFTQKLRGDFEIAGHSNVEIKVQKTWNYFPRFTQQGLIEEIPWKIKEIQGDTNTFWLGSSLTISNL
ncbi:FAD/NAD(P)-binding domain-containing protein [Rhizoclosmatium globosum]|uniref:FAD/NAD(P)-binding domain-containing protein n=1 Tax=Rhizoclosmatium globosum TaxID=329046 RepID=A0A1Y2BV33_9FUNG|nr:FAD/NAD(P)-binding domain-containing protein [Rhizoclosmatium globosum]|eukprot:ORY38621.1 FAD/NAD(P)-binding domain-containing protein [Rhizoclosmatium globosum]